MDEAARLQRAAGCDLEVKTLIGRGAFADVYDGYDLRLKRRVALKVLRHDVATAANTAQRFRREAEIIAQLRHPNILPIHDIREADGLVILVLDRIDGGSLEDLLRDSPRVHAEEAARILGEIAGALAAAHEAGIIHRDLKPSNILLDGPGRRVLLTDFGVAAAMDEDGADALRAFAGTPQYASPEQAAGDRIDERSDLYSLGVIGYRMLTGAPPFDAPTVGATLLQHMTRPATPVRRLCAECPAWLAAAVERALAKSPADRWPDAAALRAALDTRQRLGGEADEVPDELRVVQRQVVCFRRNLGLMVLALVIAAAVDTLLPVPTVLPLTLLAVVMFGGWGYGRLWMAGVTPRDVLRGSARRTAEPKSDEFGRHAEWTDAARQDRNHIVRLVAARSHLEQQRLRGCVEAADQLLARVAAFARRLHALDQQIGAERQSGRTRTRLTPELVATRSQLQSDLATYAGELGDLRVIVERLDRIDGAAVSDRLRDIELLLRTGVTTRAAAAQPSP